VRGTYFIRTLVINGDDIPIAVSVLAVDQVLAEVIEPTVANCLIVLLTDIMAVFAGFTSTLADDAEVSHGLLGDGCGMSNSPHLWQYLPVCEVQEAPQRGQFVGRSIIHP